MYSKCLLSAQEMTEATAWLRPELASKEVVGMLSTQRDLFALCLEGFKRQEIPSKCRTQARAKEPLPACLPAGQLHISTIQPWTTP